jgi:hypothetical protein
MTCIEVQPRQVVVEGHVVDLSLLEAVLRHPVERHVFVAGQHVVTLEERSRPRQVVGDELVVTVEEVPRVAPER